MKYWRSYWIEGPHFQCLMMLGEQDLIPQNTFHSFPESEEEAFHIKTWSWLLGSIFRMQGFINYWRFYWTIFCQFNLLSDWWKVSFFFNIEYLIIGNSTNWYNGPKILGWIAFSAYCDFRLNRNFDASSQFTTAKITVLKIRKRSFTNTKRRIRFFHFLNK